MYTQWKINKCKEVWDAKQQGMRPRRTYDMSGKRILKYEIIGIRLNTQTWEVENSLQNLYFCIKKRINKAWKLEHSSQTLF
jgi:hypothetical protein